MSAAMYDIVKKTPGFFTPEPILWTNPDPFPPPATKHLLEIVPQNGTIFARFPKHLEREVWLDHRFVDHDGKHRREPFFALPVFADFDEAREARVEKHLQRAVTRFNKSLARAERMASGKPLSRWERLREVFS